MLMKYRRKTPVEAIQWNGDNLNEVYDFIIKTAKSCCANKSCCAKDDYSDLIIAYEDRRGRKFKTVIPLFGWIVREGNTFQFYKDATFRKTFEEAKEDGNEEITDSIIKNVNQMLEDVRASIENGQMFAKYSPQDSLASFINNFYRDGVKPRKEVKKKLSEGLKDMAGSDTHKATFESVLDEMKELHAKKDKDYGSAFHKSFEEFGVTSGVVRLNDKMERVKSLVKNGKAEIKDESLLDSLKDAACYAVMLYVELKNKKNG